jgi:OOP family OmpA-OmpF porin
MKISLLGKLMLGTAVMALTGTAFAGAVPNATDSSGAPIRDASGACVVSSGIEHPDCKPKVAPAPAAPASVRQSIVIQADALFDFDKSVVRPDGKKSIDEALAKLKGVDLEMVIATGHTDSVGSDAYNQKLSERRAAAVKDYLVSKGIPASKVTTIGKGESQPVATNKTAEGRQKNRRVDIEFKGVRQ